MIGAIEKLMEDDTAGDPAGNLKWTRKTTAKIAEQIGLPGIKVSGTTVARLMREMGYSLRVNHKKVCSCSPESRDQQFEYIAAMKGQCELWGQPIVSVDTKKKELVGNFKNPGATWRREPIPVKDHDFRSDAKGIAIPYGVYDVQANRGSVFLGVSNDTPAFAVASLEKWWRFDGRRRYASAKEILVLADCGGSNGHRARAWKHGIQEKLCDRHGLSITVMHYPSGASKCNPIEYKLFSEISKNRGGRPLDDYETVLNYLRTTKTRTGLLVKAYLDPKQYPKNVKISDDAMADLRIERHSTLPTWNYTLHPRNGH